MLTTMEDECKQAECYCSSESKVKQASRMQEHVKIWKQERKQAKFKQTFNSGSKKTSNPIAWKLDVQLNLEEINRANCKVRATK